MHQTLFTTCNWLKNVSSLALEHGAHIHISIRPKIFSQLFDPHIPKRYCHKANSGWICVLKCLIAWLTTIINSSSTLRAFMPGNVLTSISSKCKNTQSSSIFFSNKDRLHWWPLTLVKSISITKNCIAGSWHTLNICLFTCNTFRLIVHSIKNLINEGCSIFWKICFLLLKTINFNILVLIS